MYELKKENAGIRMAFTLISTLLLLTACGELEDYAADPYDNTFQPMNQETSSASHQTLLHSKTRFAIEASHRINGVIKAQPDLEIRLRTTQTRERWDDLNDEELILIEDQADEPFWIPGEANETEMPGVVDSPQPDEDPDLPATSSLNKRTPIKALSTGQFEWVCKALNTIYENADEVALSEGACTYKYASGHWSMFDLETVSCERELNHCYDEVALPHVTSALCDDSPAIPADCDINFVQIQTCLQNVHRTQVALAEQNVCEVTSETITHTRVLLNEHRKALHCLEKLENHCPSLKMPQVP